jgi:hypothetical protein
MVSPEKEKTLQERMTSLGKHVPTGLIEPREIP